MDKADEIKDVGRPEEVNETEENEDKLHEEESKKNKVDQFYREKNRRFPGQHLDDDICERSDALGAVR